MGQGRRGVLARQGGGQGNGIERGGTGWVLERWPRRPTPLSLSLPIPPLHSPPVKRVARGATVGRAERADACMGVMDVARKKKETEEQGGRVLSCF